MIEFFNDPKLISLAILIGSFTIFGIAMVGVLTQKNLIKIFIALSIAEASLFLYFIGSHFQSSKLAPIVTPTLKNFSSTQMVDPVPQAMILTTIVIAIAVLALALSYITKYFSFTNNLDISKMDELGEEK
jgi:multicomponent Na+:H+ antiporter subunit C